MSQADKATAAELLRAAEHMRQRGEALSLTGNRLKTVHGQANVQAAEALEREAKRLQAIEAQQTYVIEAALEFSNLYLRDGHIVETQPRRSWPEGWPPFAVLRRAFMSLEVSPTPSTMAVERRRRDNPTAKWAAAARRRAWDKAVRVGSRASLASALEVAPVAPPQGPKNRPASEAE